MSETVTVSVRMPAELHGMLKILAEAEGRSLSKEVIQIILDWVTMMKGEPAAARDAQSAARWDATANTWRFTYTTPNVSEKDFLEAQRKWQMWRPANITGVWTSSDTKSADLPKFDGTVVEFTTRPSVSGITGVQCQLSINIDDSYDLNSVKALVESKRVSIQPLNEQD